MKTVVIPWHRNAYEAAAELASRARANPRGGGIRTNFNGTWMTANPGDTKDEIFSAWDREQTRRVLQYNAEQAAAIALLDAIAAGHPFDAAIDLYRAARLARETPSDLDAPRE